MRLLLMSNSTAPGRGYLEHVTEPLGEILDGVRTVAFVPFALADHDGYTATVAGALARFGVRVGEDVSLADLRAKFFPPFDGNLAPPAQVETPPVRTVHNRDVRAPGLQQVLHNQGTHLAGADHDHPSAGQIGE